MICYKDKTFCSSNCTRSDCHRYFTEEDRKGAKEWAKDLGIKEAPIAWSDYSGTCFWYKPPIKKDPLEAAERFKSRFKGSLDILE